MSLTDLRGRLDKLIKRVGTVTLSDAELDQALYFAARQFSQWSPRHRISELTADGTSYLALPGDYLWETSSVEWIEYPVDRTPASFLVPGEDYILRRTASAQQVHFLRSSPSSGDTVRLAYTTLHTLDAATDTIPASLADAVVYLAGAHLARALASYFNRNQDASLEADVINFQSRAETWLRLAAQWDRMARSLLGIAGDQDVPAAVALGDFDVLNAQQRSFLTHPRTLR
jgi:hypothetical protein